MTDWLIKQGREHPARMILVGFVPILVYMGWITWQAWQTDVLSGVMVTLMFLGCVCLVVAIAAAADLLRPRDRDKE